MSVADADDVTRGARQIITMFEAKPDLFLAACANPVRALRDAGVELSPVAARYVALRCRFSPAEAERLGRLAQQIDEHLGPVDPDDDAAVSTALLKVDVKVVAADHAPTVTLALDTADSADQPGAEKRAPSRKRAGKPRFRRTVLGAAETLPQVQRWREVKRIGPDPFEKYQGTHPVVDALLEYRRTSATQPRFASDEVYERLARTTDGQLAEGINIRLRARLSGND